MFRWMFLVSLATASSANAATKENNMVTVGIDYQNSVGEGLDLAEETPAASTVRRQCAISSMRALNFIAPRAAAPNLSNLMRDSTCT
jgi:hypothetical protein